jgi:hypothetical protein
MEQLVTAVFGTQYRTNPRVGEGPTDHQSKTRETVMKRHFHIPEHDEIRPDETFVCNATIEEFWAIPLITKRFGNIAYDCMGEDISEFDLVPIFASEIEIKFRYR